MRLIVAVQEANESEPRVKLLGNHAATNPPCKNPTWDLQLQTNAILERHRLTENETPENERLRHCFTSTVIHFYNSYFSLTIHKLPIIWKRITTYSTVLYTHTHTEYTPLKIKAKKLNSASYFNMSSWLWSVLNNINMCGYFTFKFIYWHNPDSFVCSVIQSLWAVGVKWATVSLQIIFFNQHQHSRREYSQLYFLLVSHTC